MSYDRCFYRDARYCDPPGPAILSEELRKQRVRGLGCAYDLLGHWAEDDAWVYGFVSLVDGYHRDLWADLKPEGHFDSKGDLRP